MSETPETEETADGYDRVEHYKLMVEGILATSHRPRERCNESAARALAGLRQDFPDVSDETLFTIMAEIGLMISMIAGEPLAKISSTLDTMFANVTIGAASLIGAYDLGDTDSKMRTLEEILEERFKASQGEAETPSSDDTGTGMYL